MTKRHIVKHLTLKEISSVDHPAQVGAMMTIMKRGETSVSTIAKALATGDAPKTFDQLLTEQERERDRWKVQDKLWPLYDALTMSISQTVRNQEDLSTVMPAIENNVEQFMAAVRAELPDIQEDVSKALLAYAVAKREGATGETSMTTAAPKIEDVQKSLGEKEAENATLKSQLAVATMLGSLSDADRVVVLKMSDKDKKELAEEADEGKRKEKITKARDADETFEFEGQTITKSGTSPAVFAMMKSMKARQDTLEADMLKSADASLEVTLKARVATDLGKLPGTPEQKLSLLKSAHKLPQADREYLDQVLATAGTQIADVLKRHGTGHGTAAPLGETTTTKAAIASLDTKTDDIMKSRNIKKRSDAYAMAVAENPDLAEAANA